MFDLGEKDKQKRLLRQLAELDRVIALADKAMVLIKRGGVYEDTTTANGAN